jgi:hypothetical protein
MYRTRASFAFQVLRPSSSGMVLAVPILKSRTYVAVVHLTALPFRCRSPIWDCASGPPLRVLHSAMKLPPLTDPCWADFIRGDRDYPFKCLASRIMYGQVKVVGQRDPAHAIRLAYEYFQRNEALAAEDLQIVFGHEHPG